MKGSIHCRTSAAPRGVILEGAGGEAGVALKQMIHHLAHAVLEAHGAGGPAHGGAHALLLMGVRVELRGADHLGDDAEVEGFEVGGTHDAAESEGVVV
ncbi:MAG: hypothetical protein U5N21_16735 [Rhodococcus sp. (in: high G+C Gram-positive bacteria)]|nr:hypothetical protein [Rhodococcus sp. (in: high G+C Gram-positive bacteria)]